MCKYVPLCLFCFANEGVNFCSREFIREYSASHPESSGLKAVSILITLFLILTLKLSFFLCNEWLNTVIKIMSLSISGHKGCLRCLEIYEP